VFQLLLVTPLARGVEGTEHIGQQCAVFGRLVEITAAAEDQLLLQPQFHMAVQFFDDAVVMGHAAVVVTGAQSVVGAERLVTGIFEGHKPTRLRLAG